MTIAVVVSGYDGGGLADSVRDVPRVLRVAGTRLPDPRGIHPRQVLPIARLHAAPGGLGHTVGPRQVPPRSQVNLYQDESVVKKSDNLQIWDCQRETLLSSNIGSSKK